MLISTLVFKTFEEVGGHKKFIGLEGVQDLLLLGLRCICQKKQNTFRRNYLGEDLDHWGVDHYYCAMIRKPFILCQDTAGKATE